MTEQLKRCFKCEARKPRTEFYRHPQMADGLLGKCKECAKRDVAENTRRRIEYYRKYERGRARLPHRVEARRRYTKTDAGRTAHRRAMRAYRARYPLAYKARSAVGNAIRDGRLVRPDACENCGGSDRIHAHHDDYNKPLDVRWLCEPCHQEWHKHNTPTHEPMEQTP